MSGPAVRPVVAAAAAQPLDDQQVALNYYPTTKKNDFAPEKNGAVAGVGASCSRGSGRGTVVVNVDNSLSTGVDTTIN